MTEGYKFGQLGNQPPCVIYATDLSVGSRNAGFYAAFLAKRFSSSFFVAHAFTLSQAAMEVEANGSSESQQRKDLELLVSRRAQSLAPEAGEAVPVLLEGDPKEAIPRFAEKHAPSLLVLGSHGGSRVERGILGSVAEGILRSTREPSLTVGPRVVPVTASTFPFRRILVVAGAADHARSLARVFGAEIDVLQVVHPEIAEDADKIRELKNRSEAALEGLRQEGKFPNLNVFVEAGEAHRRILQHVKERSVDLLALEELSGSGDFQLIMDAPCPVLTIPR